MSGKRYSFGPFRLEDGLLFRDSQRISVTPKVVETLQVLVAAEGRIVSKDELMHQVWPDTFVDESSLTSNISVLRKALGVDADGRAYIETIPKRGYRLVVSSPPDNSKRVPSVPQPPGDRGLRVAIASSVSVLLVLLAFFLSWKRLSVPPTQAEKRIMVAVLPVQNLTGDARNEYITDGLTEEIIAQLSRFNPERLGVIARTSSMAYKTTNKTAQQIGTELNSDFLVESSMRGADPVHITVQLIRTHDQTHVWSEEYNRSMGDLFSVQDELSRAIALHLRVQIAGAAQAHLGARPLHPDAHLAYLEGRFYWNQRSPRALEQAVASFQKAIALDPSYALAYSGLADAYSSQCLIADVSPIEIFPKAKAAAQKALELDSGLAEAHNSLAYVLFWFDWNWNGAEAESKRALDLNPGYAMAHQWYSNFLALMGRETEAIAENQKALELDPVSLIINMQAGLPYYFLRRYDQAILHFQRALQLDPGFSLARCDLAWAYEEKGEIRLAIEELERAAKTNDSAPILSALGHAYAVAGRRTEAEKILSTLRERSAKRYVSPFFPATVYLGLRENDRALELLEQAYVNHDWVIIWIYAGVKFDPVRFDPRFVALLHKLNLPPSPAVS